MAQHFLLSAAARTLSLKAIYPAGEDKAYETFRKLRWSETGGEPVCPRCGSLDDYEIPTRRKFKCAAKGAGTSSASRAGRSSPPQDGLHRSARRDLHLRERRQGHFRLPAEPRSGLPVQDGLRAAHKLREALAAEIAGAELDGEVEIDGSYYGGHIRPANKVRIALTVAWPNTRPASAASWWRSVSAAGARCPS